jgi:hypothetical protein
VAIVTNITKRVEIPHEEGEFMEFKKLSWKQLESASEISSDALMVKIKNMGGDIVKALRETTQEQKADPKQGYDRESILRKGIVKWSYDAPVTPDNISDLDEETAAWAFKEILDMNLPRSEEEVKNA